MPMPAKDKPNRQTIKDALPAGHGKTDAEVDAALAQVDADTIHDEERAALTVEVWDRTSPINGVPAQHFLDRDDVDENGTDDIYLVKQGGQVVMFQPHEPGVAGLVRIPKGQGKTKGAKHADDIAVDRARGRTIDEVRKKLEV